MPKQESLEEQLRKIKSASASKESLEESLGKIEVLSKVAQGYQSEIERLTEETKSLKKLKGSNSRKIQGYETRIQKLTEKLQTQQEKYNSEIEKLQTQTKTKQKGTKKRIEGYESRLQGLEKEKSKLEGEISSYKAREEIANQPKEEIHTEPPKPKPPYIPPKPKEKTASQKAKELYEKAESAWFKNSKIKSLRQAVELDPNFSDAHFKLASIYFQKGEYLRAAKEYELTRDINRDSGESLATMSFLIANAYIGAGESFKAISNAEKGLSILPTNLFGIGVLARGLENTGELEKALELYYRKKEMSSWLSKDRKAANEGISRLESKINAQKQSSIRREVPVARAYSGTQQRAPPQTQDSHSLFKSARDYMNRGGRENLEKATIAYRKAHESTNDESLKKLITKDLHTLWKKAIPYQVEDAESGKMNAAELLHLGKGFIYLKDNDHAGIYFKKAKEHPSATTQIKQEASNFINQIERSSGFRLGEFWDHWNGGGN
ncbi:hypothetical protein GOV06_01500 [Candidatus Woesearchaeota archaeon]|nr:hypothetical protein [Candidatus Woesearchaeota archaeon]